MRRYIFRAWRHQPRLVDPVKMTLTRFVRG
jgi:hypothetical protein